MKHEFSIKKHEYHLPDQHIVYRIYRNPKADTKRRLVLLHGAGVAGVDTWEFILSSLTHWSEVLVPDLRGTGETHYPDGKEHPYEVQALVGDLNALVDHLGWWTFDLAGYSMGGLVSLIFKQQHSDRVGKQFLLESAVLDRPCWETTVDLRQQFSAATVHLRGKSDINKGVVNFLDAISPNRRVSPQVETLTIQRLGQRPEGFANALECVTTAIKHLDRESLVAAQGDVSSFIGGNSVDLMHQYQQELAERLPNWHYFLMPGTDHSLPFQKPRQIAKIMNEEMARYLSN
ncbi:MULTISPECIES: alpha/beta hydrolase [unclassified Neptuniibacter]|uniref:alpha/beta fold hydrolase n=1 Tax=unclassified Neptuniibacter TaxID=2630693 RepID=UPI000C432E17|nr:MULTISPECIES: alpha/beta hydrolase [unclassified Neptuniibacter]MAY42754.1 alpha/beta hydrolase [Oceanospirillaceae bacterium]|tara:strand:- start:7446 stop:8312 length:867 start_codon:yes stop_codon:yes gene_type:complete